MCTQREARGNRIFILELRVGQEDFLNSISLLNQIPAMDNTVLSHCFYNTWASSISQHRTEAWGDGLGNKVLAVQTWRHELGLVHPLTAKQGSTCLSSQHWEDRKTRGPYWLASLASLISFRFIEDFVSKNEVTRDKGRQPACFYGFHKCRHRHMILHNIYIIYSWKREINKQLFL